MTPASPERNPALSPQESLPWWKGAVIYQIYPRSFMDSNGDGVGDLAGITDRLEHVASLGVDAVWISPFFKSPMHDFGYDVADFCGVDPLFGSLDDFDRLIAKAHGLGIKVIIDQVFSHSSDQHPWFTESRSSRDNPKADWYVWADPKPDGTAPNNWQSIFSGPAWTWDARRRQYYFHNFLTQQPDLNLHNPDVQQALLDAARFWLDRGVDGFRFDAVLHMMHDPELTDNPPALCNRPKSRGHDFQQNIHNQGHPAIFDFLERLRALTNEYGAIFTVAEVGGTGAQQFTMACAEGDRRLNSAYGFDFLYADELSAELVCKALAGWPQEEGVGWPTWAFENHDAPRGVSRWAKPAHRDAFARMKMALFASLRGNIILYQGEELALEQDEIPFELLQDPEAIANWPLTLSRDGVRTPMPWQAEAEQGGFTTGTPWLPLSENNLGRAVDRQDSETESILNFTRSMIALRQATDGLKWGSAICEAHGNLLQLDRAAPAGSVRCLFNFGDKPVAIAGRASGKILLAINDATPEILPPYGALLVERL